MKGTIASVGIGIATVFGAVEASMFNETPLERVETIKNERVEVRQVGNVVETTMPWKGEQGIKIKVDMGEPTLTERLADKRKMEVVTEAVLSNRKEIEQERLNWIVTLNDPGLLQSIVLKAAVASEVIGEGGATPQDVSFLPEDKRVPYIVDKIEELDQQLLSGDGFKIDFLLNEKPDTNIFCQTIEGAENYTWNYQPPLTPEEIAEGAQRPENVVGSYAVYHETLANRRNEEVDRTLYTDEEWRQMTVFDGTHYSELNESTGEIRYFKYGTNYETGKAWHIYRPQVWSLSSSSTKEWAELSFVEKTNQLCVVVPQKFLDEAVYPVRVDPTFGITTEGGTQVSVFGDDAHGSLGTLSEDGTITKITGYFDEGGVSTDAVKMFIGTEDNSALISNGVSEPVAIDGSTATWYDAIFSTEPTPTAANYWLMAIFAQTSPTDHMYFDSGVSGDGQQDINNDYTTVEAVGTGTDRARLYSIYATYTAAGGAEEPGFEWGQVVSR